MERTFVSKHGGKTEIKIDDFGLTIHRKGFMNAMNQGLKGDKTIPYSSISAVQLKKPGMTNGYIQFSLLGGNESRGGITAAVHDENTVMFAGKKTTDEMIELKAIVEGKIAEIHQSQSSAAVQPGSDLDQLAKLKDLLDAGVLTQDEFDAKKAQILNL
jgi:membrane protease subunit (stomatin/prohibitin family)